MGELSQTMGAREFAEWQVYYEREAFGHDIDRLQGGLVAATIANVHRDGRKKPIPYKAREFTIAPPAPPYMSRRALRRKGVKV